MHETVKAGKPMRDQWHLRASLLVVLSLLTSPAMASAECAWVLWEGNVGYRDITTKLLQTYWSRLDAFDTRKGCVRTIDTAASKLGLDATTRFRPGEGSRASETLLYQYKSEKTLQCLPDSVDPRRAP